MGDYSEPPPPGPSRGPQLATNDRQPILSSTTPQQPHHNRTTVLRNTRQHDHGTPDHRKLGHQGPGSRTISQKRGNVRKGLIHRSMYQNGLSHTSSMLSSEKKGTKRTPAALPLP